MASTIPHVRRAWPTLLAVTVFVAGIAYFAALLGGGDAIPASAVAGTATPLPVAEGSGYSVRTPTPRVLAEMTRRLGTPRQVRISARKRARALARIAAQLRAERRAAAARRRAAAA